MPNNSEHCAKLEKNCRFIEIESLRQSFKEWYVTGVFYCSVHLIEGYLAGFQNKDTTNHRERLELLKQDSFLRKILSDYILIYHESIRARYYNEEFTDDDIKTIDEKWDNIETILYPMISKLNNRRVSS